MSIRIKCVCGARLKAPDDCLGKSVRCSVCGSGVYIPGAKASDVVHMANKEVQAWIRIECQCGKVIKSPPEWAGKQGNCPRCGTENVMPTAEPSNVRGEHEVERIEEQVEGPKPLKSMVRPAPAPGPTPLAVAQAKAQPPRPPPPRPLPRPHPTPVAEPNGLVRDYEAEEEDAKKYVKYVEEHALRKSGLLDLTGREDVKIVDGVAPAVWDAKLAQRAKAKKAGPESQRDFYVKNADQSESKGGSKKLLIVLTIVAVVLAVAIFFLLRSF